MGVILHIQEDAVRIAKKCMENVQSTPGHIGDALFKADAIAGVVSGLLLLLQSVLVVCNRSQWDPRC